jgi:hypothetical protein
VETDLIPIHLTYAKSTAGGLYSSNVPITISGHHQIVTLKKHQLNHEHIWILFLKINFSLGLAHEMFLKH